jgi:hypothetical protein
MVQKFPKLEGNAVHSLEAKAVYNTAMLEPTSSAGASGLVNLRQQGLEINVQQGMGAMNGVVQGQLNTTAQAQKLQATQATNVNTNTGYKSPGLKSGSND